ncbi:MAG: tetratricopeptide repeat protein [Crocosphaera sp.]
MSANTLEAIFVQRHKLVENLIELVCDSAETANNYFSLLIGMRGIGKTHTIALIYHRLKKKEELEDKLLIAWLKEEEWGVSSWLELLIRIFSALETEYPELYKNKLQEKGESLYQLSADDATDQAERMLKEFIGDKTLLLLTENLDEIFKGLGDIGQKQFRAYLQNYNLITIIATSQSLFAGVSEKESPFYGFFAPKYLDKLTIEAATELLRNIAELQKDKELESFIKSPIGKDRIKAIHHLAGGNHRVYVIFSQFLTRNSLDELVKPVMKTLDELTPYYQARMQWLSPQQRKMIELLCEKSNALPVKEIAKRCFISHQTASGQLKELRKKGYVTAEAVGRESFYELQEPLMRICLEVKKQRGEPIKLFIDFLRIWYSKKELQERLQQLPENCLEREYINHALVFKDDLMKEKEYTAIGALVDEGIEQLVSGNPERALELFEEAIKNNDHDSTSWYMQGMALAELERYDEAISSYNKALEIKPNYDQAWNNRGITLANLGRFDEAIASYNKALEFKPDYDQAWNSRGVALDGLRRFDDAIASYDKALEIKPDNYEAWYNRGMTLGNLLRFDEAIASYDKALEIKSDVYLTWYNRGVALGNLGRFDEAIASYNKALEIKPDEVDAWNNRGVALDNLGRFDEAITSFDKALELKSDVFEVWNNRGITLSNLERFEQAITSYKKALEFKPDLHQVWSNQGNVLRNLGRFKEAVASYNKALEFKPDFVDAWNNRGVALFDLGRFDEAITSFDKVLEFKPDEVDAWNNRGVVLDNLGRLEEAIASFDKAISLNIKESSAWFNRIEVIFKLNNWEEGFKQLDDALNRFVNQTESYTGDTKEYIKIIWDSTRDIDVWKSRIETLVKTYDKHQVVSNLSKGMVDHIPILMSEMVSDKLARTWLEIWQSIVGDKLELSIALRFLKIAVEYKESKGDRRVLMKLAKEEREILEPLVKIQ